MPALPPRYRKSQLPHKTCARCGRPFAWRRKWARCREAVKYSSARCRGAAGRSP